MKPIFGIDITSDKNNEIINGSEFITKTISKQKAEDLESKREKLDQTVNDSKLPLWLRIIKYICGIYALLMLAGIIKALPEVGGLDQVFRNAPFFIVSAVACGLIWVLLQFFAKKKEDRVLEEQNAEQQMEEIDTDIQSIYDELNVPCDAASVDVLGFAYKIKKGEVCVQARPFETTVFFNFDLKIYATDECLCLADLENVYSFKLAELKAIQTVNKRISVPSWNKEEEPTKGEFKKYKITVDDMEDVYFKPYHILEGEHDGEVFGIYFPCYELDTFESLTGLRASE
ncbi:MAG: hypothetical protein E7589_02710 [Ruminococcaceae bacterium]|nr:hypothetical protein [Oscillospiraceae bacterium]